MKEIRNTAGNDGKITAEPETRLERDISQSPNKSVTRP